MSDKELYFAVNKNAYELLNEIFNALGIESELV